MADPIVLTPIGVTSPTSRWSSISTGKQESGAALRGTGPCLGAAASRRWNSSGHRQGVRRPGGADHRVQSRAPVAWIPYRSLYTA